MKTIIKGLNVYTEDRVLSAANVLLAEKKIAMVDAVSADADNIYHFPDSWHLLPGMIDMHIHGANGSDVLDGDFLALQNISNSLLQEGVTAFLPTIMTAPIDVISKALANIATFKKEQRDGAEILGINLEGPFLSSEKRGAQKVSALAEPDANLFNEFQRQAAGLIKLATVAPELPNAFSFIDFLVKNKVLPALGHSNATYEQGQQAIFHGMKHATHLFDGMRVFHHRDPGAVTALLLDDEVSVEFIADGKHLHAAILNLITRLKPLAKMILITDAMRAKNLKDDEYDLGGQKVFVNNQQAHLVNGTLAGSTLSMDAAIRNMLKLTKVSLFDLVQMSAANPAKILGCFAHKGSITEAKDADLVIMNQDYQVMATIKAGAFVYQAKELNLENFSR